jgi:glycosyltransferase involved in cell wall biosynthesis
MIYSILHLIPFPIGNARHGGQIRARETNKALQNFGFDVTTIEVFDAGAYAPERPSIDISEALATGAWPLAGQIRDYSTGAALVEGDREFAKLKSLLPQRVDLVVVEEPWLGQAAIRLRREGLVKAPILFNSYNVEHVAKRSILEEAKIEGASKYIERITAIEEALVKEADCCSTVTTEDAATYRRWAPTQIVVAPNGTLKRKRTHLRNVIHRDIEREAKYALFVGSAHPPNLVGLRDLVIGAIATVRSDERIVVAGSVCDLLHHNVAGLDFPYMFRDKLCLVGRVSDFGLDCLIANASIMLLPITIGGGSNLKTAEALMSGKPIVTTEKAFRGYEEFLSAPGIRVGNSRREFAAAMRASFDLDHGNEFVRSETEKLLWRNTLSPIVNAAAKLVGAQMKPIPNCEDTD